MGTELIARHLQLHVFSSNQPEIEDQPLFNRVYDFWHQHWLATFRELDGSEYLDSDDFLRHNEKVFLMYKDEIIAYMGHVWFDLNLKSDIAHSYFKAYPKEALDFLAGHNLTRGMTIGYFCVAPKWRKSESGPLVAECLMNLSFQRFKHSSLDTLICYTRNNRGIDKMVYRLGSKCIRSGVKQHGVEVDFIYTHRADVRESEDHFIRKTVQRLWRDRTVYGAETARPLRVA